MEENGETKTESLEKNQSHVSQVIERIFSALSLITIGVVFLLNTTNIVSWSMWQYVFIIFFSIWPVFLILAGIQIIFNRYWFTKIIGSLLGYLLFLVVIFASIGATTSPSLQDQIRNRTWAGSWFNQNKNLKEESFSIQKDKYRDLNTREINAKIAAGNFHISEGGGNYLDLKAKFTDEYGRPKLTDSQNSNNLKINFDEEENTNFFITSFWKSPEYDFKVGETGIESNINLEMTAGDGQINLSELELRNLIVKMTAGNLDIDLKNKSLPQNMEIKLTAGDLNLTLPKNTGLDIEYKKTAGSLKVDGNNLNSNEDNYFVNTHAEKKIKIKIEITAGDIDVDLK